MVSSCSSVRGAGLRGCAVAVVVALTVVLQPVSGLQITSSRAANGDTATDAESADAAPVTPDRTITAIARDAQKKDAAGAVHNPPNDQAVANLLGRFHAAADPETPPVRIRAPQFPPPPVAQKTRAPAAGTPLTTGLVPPLPVWGDHPVQP